MNEVKKHQMVIQPFRIFISRDDESFLVRLNLLFGFAVGFSSFERVRPLSRLIREVVFSYRKYVRSFDNSLYLCWDIRFLWLIFGRRIYVGKCSDIWDELI